MNPEMKRRTDEQLGDLDRNDCFSSDQNMVGIPMRGFPHQEGKTRVPHGQNVDSLEFLQFKQYIFIPMS